MHILKKKYVKSVLQRSIGLIILLIIISRIDFTELAELISQSRVFYLSIAVLLFIPSLFLRSVRLFFIMKAQGIKLTIWESISLYSYSIFVGSITPGRIGEFVKAVYFHKKGNTLSASFYGTLLDRLFDVLVISLIGSTVFFMLAGVFKEINTAIISIYLIVLSISSIAILNSNILNIIIDKSTKIFGRRNLMDKLSPSNIDTKDFVIQLNIKAIVLSFIITTLALICNFSSIYYLTKSIGLDIPYFDMLGISAVVALVSMIPITFLGIGTRDLVLIQLLSLYGIGKVESIALSTLILFLLISNALICSFSLLTNIGKLRWKETTRELI